MLTDHWEECLITLSLKFREGVAWQSHAQIQRRPLLPGSFLSLRRASGEDQHEYLSLAESVERPVNEPCRNHALPRVSQCEPQMGNMSPMFASVISEYDANLGSASQQIAGESQQGWNAFEELQRQISDSQETTTVV